MEIRRSYDRLISTMGFPILVRRYLYIESGPRVSHNERVMKYDVHFLSLSAAVVSTFRGNIHPAKTIS